MEVSGASLRREIMIKARIKSGTFEIEYEGAEEFFRSEFLGIAEEIRNRLSDASGAEPEAVVSASLARQSERVPSTSTGTTRSIAARLSAKTGPDLLLAAAARLNIVEDRDRFRRQDLLEEIKTASGYFKANMAKNLSQNLKTLIKDGKLIELANEVYTLSAGARTDLENKVS
jgi:hypothetical protein